MSKKKSVQETEPVILIDHLFDHEGITLKLYADFRHILGDIEEYKQKLSDARNIPSSDQILPDDPILELIEKQPDVTAMPDNTREQQFAKNRYILTTAQSYYRKQRDAAHTDAVILALTIDNLLTEEPEEYDEEKVVRVLPGMGVPLPEPKRNLDHPVEKRLKQVLDRLVQIPGSLKKLEEVISMMTIDTRQRLQKKIVTSSGLTS